MGDQPESSGMAAWRTRDQAVREAANRINNNLNQQAAGGVAPAPAIAERERERGQHARVPFRPLFVERYDPDPPILVPRSTRQYGVRPRGVIFRIRDPPAWVRTFQGRTILREMNLQGLFNSEIDAAYRVLPIVPQFRKIFSFIVKFLSLLSKLETFAIISLVIYIGFMYAYHHMVFNEYFLIVTRQ